MTKRKKVEDYTKELEACPFCKSKNLIYTGTAGGVFIECWGCWARGPFIKRSLHPRNLNQSATEAWIAAKRRWNKRRSQTVKVGDSFP